MEWLLIGFLFGRATCDSGRRQREFEESERRRQYEEQKEFEAFVASLEGLSPAEKEERWKARGAAMVAIQACIAACCIF